MAVLIGIVFLASFVYAIYVGSFNQDEAYLMTTTRAWQLAFGGLLALVGGFLRLPRSLRGPAGWIGVGLIVFCGVFLDGAHLFPGPWSLWPLAGLTLVLIAAGPNGGDNDPPWSATKFLSNGPLAWVGDHAYGLYLWHWPLLIYYMEIRDREAIGIRGAIVILAITIVLAILMHKYIEAPLSKVTKQVGTKGIWSNRPSVMLGAGLMAVAGLLTTALSPSEKSLDAYGDLNTEVYPGAAEYFMSGKTPDAEMFPAIGDAGEYKQEYLQRGCAQDMGEDPGTDTIKVCADEGAPANPTATIVLAGGSHAGHWEAAFKSLARKYNWEVLIVIKSSCVFGWEEHPEETMCGQWNENFVDWLQGNDVDLVVTPGSRQDPSHEHEYVVDAAPDWWSKIAQTGTDLMLVRGTPRNGGSVPDCLASGRSEQDCGPSKSKFKEVDPLTQMELPDSVYPIDITKYVCPRINDSSAANCDAVVGNVLVWFDGHHFTTPFSQSLARGFEAEMEKAVPELVR